MKTAYAITGLLLVSALHGADKQSTVVYQDDNVTQTLTTVVRKDRLSFGPDIFWVDERPSLHGIKMRDDSVYYGIRAGYDYLKPNTIYGGIEGMYAFGRTHVKINTNQIHFDKSRHSCFTNLEGRIGYNFFAPHNLFFTPFVGVGGYHTRLAKSLHFTENWVYFALGLRTEYAINPTFNIGLYLKGTTAVFSESHVRVHGVTASNHSTKNVLGYEVDLPISFNFASRWDLCVEPYYLKLNARNDASIVGGRLLVGYRI